MPYFSGLLDRLRSPTRRGGTLPPSLLQALQTSIPPLRAQRPDFERLGQWLQGVNIPVPSQEVANRTMGLGPSQLRAGGGLLESMLQSYGRTIEDVSTPRGRRGLLESLGRTVRNPIRSDVLSEPAVEAAFNIPDVLPGGFIFGGVTALGKESLEKAAKEAAEKGAREIGEKGIKSMLDVTGEGGITTKEQARLAQRKISEAKSEIAARKSGGKPVTDTPLGMEIEEATARPIEEFLQNGKTAAEEPWPDNVIAEIENEVRSELYGKSIVPKDVAGANSKAWRENWPEIRDIVSFLRKHGEETDKSTRLLYREHIPFGTKWITKTLRATDELATELGITEQELMDKLNDFAVQKASRVSARPPKTRALNVPKPKGRKYYEPLTAIEERALGEGISSKVKSMTGTERAAFENFKKRSYQDWMDSVFDVGKMEAKPVKLTTKADQTKWLEGLESATPDRGKPLFYLREYASQEDFQDLRPVLERRGLSTQRIVNKVGEKSPEVKDWLYDATVSKLYKSYDDAQGAMIGWRRSIDEARGTIKKRSEESALASKYAEGLLDLDQLKVESPKHWQEIKKFADWSSEAFKTGLDFVNKFRAEWGLDPIQPREDYVPHIAEISSFLSNLKSADDIKDLGKAPRVPVHPMSKFFRFGEPRGGTALYEDDLVSAIETWFGSATSHAYSLEPIVNLRGVAKTLEEKGVTNAAEALRTQADRVANTKDLLTMWAEGYGGAPVIRGLKALSNRIANSWVGMNVSTILLQPAGLVNATGRIGIANTLGGLQNMMSPAGKEFAYEYSSVLKGRKDIPPLDPKIGERLTKALGIPWQKLEELTVGAAFHGGVRDVLRKGGSLEDAIKWGDEVASTTQGEFRRGLREPVMSEMMGKIGMKFQSWAINTLGEIGYDIPQEIRRSVKEGKGIGKIKNKGIINAIEMLIGMAAANKIYRGISGREPFSLGGIVPSTTFPLGEVFGPAGQLPNVLVGEMSPQEEAEWERKVQNSAMSLLGGLTRLPTTQISKTTRGLEAIVRGGSYTKPTERYPEGRERFPIEGGGEKLRALLFGPWGTKAGREYLETDIWRNKKKKPQDVDWLKGFER